MDDQSKLQTRHAAAFWHAIALRRLHNYRAAREAAKLYGGDLAGLFDPPGYEELGVAYLHALRDWLPESITAARAARCALLAAIAQDRQFVHIFQDGAIVGEEKDLADQIQLIESLSGWINGIDVAEAIAAEREARQ